MGNELIYQITLAIVITSLISFVLSILRQPLIPGYILSGILLGPSFLDLFKKSPEFAVLSEIGIGFLLFLVGLELNFEKIKEVGKAALSVGIGQIVFTSVISYFVALYFGFSKIEALFISIALTFSSTIIAVKLLHDKEEIETIYGRLILGVLLTQDIFVIFILMFLSKGIEKAAFFNIIFSSVFLVALSVISAIFFLPKIFEKAAKSGEMLFLASLAWFFVFSFLAIYLGFSVEIGAFLAGVSLASLPYTYEISARIKPLRDFFVLLFFIIIGAEINIFAVSKAIMPIIAFSAFVLVGNPLILMLISGLFGYTKRVSFYSGLGIANISEFSLIFISLVKEMGYVSDIAVSLIAVITLITFTASTYFIIYNSALYQIFAPYLSIFEIRKPEKEELKPKEAGSLSRHVVVFGCHRLGFRISERLLKLNEKFIVVDFNPEIIKLLRTRGILAVYGDATNEEIMKKIKINKAKLIISTLRNLEDNLFILKKIREANKKAEIVMTANNLKDALELYKHGASYVVLPYFLGGELIAELIEKFDKQKNLINKLREEHMKEIIELRNLGLA